MDTQNYFKYGFIKVSEKLRKSFNYLHSDEYYNGNRYREFSCVDLDTFEISNKDSKTKFIQSKNYNSFLGDTCRYYNNISDNIVNDYSFQNLLNIFKHYVYEKADYKLKHVYIHQIRVCVDNTNKVTPVPEGIHQDGYDYICIFCVNRQNITGGETVLYNLDKVSVSQQILNDGEYVFLHDRNMYHYVSEIQTNDSGYRDIFVITTVR